MKISFTHIRLAIGLIILCVLAFSFNLESVFTSVSSLSLWAILLLVALAFVSMIPRTVRWKLLLDDAGTSGISFIEAFKFQLIGAAMNLVLPAGGGDVAKGYFAYRLTHIKERMLSVSLFDKLIAIASISLLSLVVFAITHKWLFLLCGILAAAPLTIFFMYDSLTGLNSIKKLETKILAGWMSIDMAELKKNVKFSRTAIFLAFLYSLFGWLIDYFLLYYCFIALALAVTVPDVMINGPLLTLGRLFPFTLNGLGTDEALMVFLFKKSNPFLAEQVILVAALLYRLTMLIVPALPGLYYLYFWKKQS